jgi:hypothetical protein
LNAIVNISSWHQKLVRFLITFVVCVAMVTVAVLAIGFLVDLITENGPHDSAFGGAVTMNGFTHGQGSLPSIFSRTKIVGVKFVLHRSNEYRPFPKDSYQVELAVPNAINPPQSFILSAGEVDTEQSVDLKFQWADGSIAKKEGWTPRQITVVVTRQSDGERKTFGLPLESVGGVF